MDHQTLAALTMTALAVASMALVVAFFLIFQVNDLSSNIDRQLAGSDSFINDHIRQLKEHASRLGELAPFGDDVNRRLNAIENRLDDFTPWLESDEGRSVEARLKELTSWLESDEVRTAELRLRELNGRLDAIEGDESTKHRLAGIESILKRDQPPDPISADLVCGQCNCIAIRAGDYWRCTNCGNAGKIPRQSPVARVFENPRQEAAARGFEAAIHRGQPSVEIDQTFNPAFLDYISGMAKSKIRDLRPSRVDAASREPKLVDLDSGDPFGYR